MLLGKTFYTSSRNEWRKWLTEHYDSEPEIWLIYYRKVSGKPRLSYDDAVLEALCFGWIDSTVKRVDDERFAQRFSPRKSTSTLSQMNRERIDELIKNKLITKAGLQAIAHVYSPNSDHVKFVIPDEILSALKANPEAWKYFQMMPESYQRIRIAYIKSRKRHGLEMYQKALNHFIKITAQNKKIGFVKERVSA
jgi:uncharacterized protein YdeI (YjbR/CyaY-like superfamily)